MQHPPEKGAGAAMRPLRATPEFFQQTALEIIGHNG
jgi:hypothetical protein